jgi:hypothetical protein
VRFQQDITPYAQPFDKLSWGAKYACIQQMPDLAMEFLTAKECGAAVETVAFASFVEDLILANRDWFDAFLVGECLWLATEDRKPEDISHRMI